MSKSVDLINSNDVTQLGTQLGTQIGTPLKTDSITTGYDDKIQYNIANKQYYRVWAFIVANIGLIISLIIAIIIIIFLSIRIKNDNNCKNKSKKIDTLLTSIDADLDKCKLESNNIYKQTNICYNDLLLKNETLTQCNMNNMKCNVNNSIANTIKQLFEQNKQISSGTINETTIIKSEPIENTHIAQCSYINKPIEKINIHRNTKQVISNAVNTFVGHETFAGFFSISKYHFDKKMYKHLYMFIEYKYALNNKFDYDRYKQICETYNLIPSHGMLHSIIVDVVISSKYPIKQRSNRYNLSKSTDDIWEDQNPELAKESIQKRLKIYNEYRDWFNGAAPSDNIIKYSKEFANDKYSNNIFTFDIYIRMRIGKIYFNLIIDLFYNKIDIPKSCVETIIINFINYMDSKPEEIGYILDKVYMLIAIYYEYVINNSNNLEEELWIPLANPKQFISKLKEYIKENNTTKESDVFFGN